MGGGAAGGAYVPAFFDGVYVPLPTLKSRAPHRRWSALPAGWVWILGHGLFGAPNVQHHPGARSATPPHLRRGVCG
jgi:heme/copper-type cytochrome/quinol oxidase subunit 1